jgi:NTP pyrophosphatase (non-canonical NTP hydrolase)
VPVTTVDRSGSKSKSTAQLQSDIANFVSDRDWEKFHAPRNLAIAITVEASELIDLFKWSADRAGIKKLMPGLRDELADVMIYCLSLCNQLGLDASELVEAKLAKNNTKYPVERYKGRWR